MNKLNQQGSATGLLIAFVLASMMLIGAAGFGFWAFASRQDYKNNVDEKIAAAVKIAEQRTATAKDSEFTEREKSPLKTYNGPGTYGSITVKYPKTWSAYVVEQGAEGTPVDGYFHPKFVPSITAQIAFALRIQVAPGAYDVELRQYEGLIQTGKLKSRAYRLAKVPSVLGTRLDGEFMTGKVGSMVLFPLRDKTLKISTEATQFKSDFDNIILKNAKFVP